VAVKALCMCKTAVVYWYTNDLSIISLCESYIQTPKIENKKGIFM
jgi:hypothetical protein